eukprot:TRINITY_DN23891_c0_g1_i1.p1 TRINITY_DN23891_c0_g1~~TRINITY_DN23891_c0_g1_i1.p1  ORF type:complete len:1004 (-),score=355.52 TRINITY_DN23891_c0_g1_i1:281-3292(-)
MNLNEKQSLNSKLKADVQEFVPQNRHANGSYHAVPSRSPLLHNSGRIDIQMPERPDSGLSKDQCYSLFPAKKKKGRNKKSPEKLLLESNFRVENNPPFKIMSKSHAHSGASQNVETAGVSWPGLEEDARSVLQNNKGGDILPKARSFADMVKKPAPVMEKCDENNIKPVAYNDSNKKLEKNMYNDNKKLEDRLKLSKNNTAMTSILMSKNKNQKVVVNQISATTFGGIGKSDDESKYVMSRMNADLEEKRRISVIRNELEVEFREPEFHFSSDDDFEVEFSANAAPRAGKNVVNKISAMTFQQIGKTSDNEKYVMKPKSWSSVVGKGLKTNLPDQNRNSLKVDTPETQSKPKGEPTIHDKIKAKMKENIELTPEEREILRQKRRERRKREKENKKKDKEEVQRQEMLKPQTSKLRFISSNILDQVKKSSTSNKEHNVKDKGIKFLDEEYPDLGVGQKMSSAIKKEKVISSEIRDEDGKLTSDRESNSEWETEDESKDREEGTEHEINDNVKIEVVTNTNSGPISYSSILKSEKKSEPLKATPAKSAEKTIAKVIQEKTEEKKKVKKKDPIALDLFSALQVKKQQPKKNAAVLSGKLKKEPLGKTVRNQLDSSAPSKKRGKEREGGKKKKKTLMKKIILADREKRKVLREEAEKRREDRIKAGVSLKPLPLKDDDEFDKVSNIDDKIKDSVEEETEAKNDHQEVDSTKLSPTVDLISSNEDGIKENSTLGSEPIETANVKTPLEMSVEEKALTALHSRKFRTYCTHLLSNELDASISLLMADLVRFQDKQHAKDPVKAKARRRYVVGLREVAKFLKVKKVCCVILAPDIERVATEGGLDDAVTKLVNDAKGQEISTLFGLNRRKLGKLCLKKVPVSCIGIMNYQGSDENYRTMQTLVASLSEDYQSKLATEIEHITSPPLVQPPARPQSSNSVLSTNAAAFVPSAGLVGGEGYYDYYGNYCDYNNSYYDDNYYNSNYYNASTGQDYSYSQGTQPWQNMIDILRK